MNFLNDNYKDLIKVASDNKGKYANAEPFPSISMTDFFDPIFLKEVLAEFPDLSKKDSIVFDDPNQIKLAGKGEKNFGEKTKQLIHFLNSEPFLIFLQELTGIKEVLLPDPYFYGAGLHEIKPGGLLKIHADFNYHNTTNLDRRLNFLVYLNEDWKEEYGGHFELWNKDMSKCVKKVLPAFNTVALFSTTDFSYHGLPDPLTCPPDRSRKSLALYYYSNGRPLEDIDPKLGEHGTVFRARVNNNNDPSDKVSLFKRIMWNITPPIINRILKR